jgi:hypothetical protein
MRSFPAPAKFLPAHFPAADVVERRSTLLTQSSCSNEATCDGGTRARTYSTFKVVSAEMPLAVRNSSIEVRRNWPLIRNSKGTGCSVSSRRFTRVESWYLRSSATVVSYASLFQPKAIRGAGANQRLEVLLTSRDEDRTSVLGQLDIRTPRAKLDSHLRRRHVVVYMRVVCLCDDPPTSRKKLESEKFCQIYVLLTALPLCAANAAL